jgi:hypothetical protein
MQMSGDKFDVLFFQNIFVQCYILVIEFRLLPRKFYVVDVIVMDDEEIFFPLDFRSEIFIEVCREEFIFVFGGF